MSETGGPSTADIEAAIDAGLKEDKAISAENTPKVASETPSTVPMTPDTPSEPTEEDQKALQDLVEKLSRESGKPVGTTSSAEQTTQPASTSQEMPVGEMPPQPHIEEAAFRGDGRPTGRKGRFFKAFGVVAAFLSIFRH